MNNSYARTIEVDLENRLNTYDKDRSAGNETPSISEVSAYPESIDVAISLEAESLGLADLIAITLANIAPAMSFYFSFGLIVVAAGIGTPLAIIAAGLAVAVVAFSAREFAAIVSSAGSLATYIGLSFGSMYRTVAAVVITVAYVITLSAITAVLGGWINVILEHYIRIRLPWEIYALVLLLGCASISLLGIRISARVVMGLIIVQVIPLLIVSISVLSKHSHSISVISFDPKFLSNGYKGFFSAIALAIFLFMGWENSTALAEESRKSKQITPKAIIFSIALSGLLYVFLAFITITGYDLNVNQLTDSPVPFLDLSAKLPTIATVFVFCAAAASMLAALITGANAVARILYSVAREDQLPGALAALSKQYKTPWIATIGIYSTAAVVAVIFGGRSDPFVFFSEAATLGAILLGLTYAATCISLPVYFRRFAQSEFRYVRHLAIPTIGLILICAAIVSLLLPGQPPPFSYFPLITLLIILISLLIGFAVNRYNPWSPNIPEPLFENIGEGKHFKK